MRLLTLDAALRHKPLVPLVPVHPLVGARGVIPSTGAPITGFDRTESRMHTRFGRQAVSEMRLVYANIGVGANHTGEFDGLAPWLLEAAVENTNVSFKQVTFGGASSLVLYPGQIVESDPVTPAMLGLGSFGGGAGVMVRTGVTMLTGDTLYGAWASSILTTGSKEAVVHSTGKASQIQGFGDFATTGYTVTPVYGIVPVMITGQWKAARDLSVGLFGDSILWGAGEAGAGAGMGEGSTGGGWGARACYSVPSSQNAKSVAWTKLCYGGDAIISHIPNHRRFLDVAGSRLTDVISDNFYNDLHSANRPVAQIVADHKVIAKMWRERGVRYHLVDPIPGCTSTDSFKTLGGQSTTTFHTDAVAYFRAACRDGIGGWNDGYMNVSAPIRDATDERFWKTDGATANLYTAADTVHPTGAAAALMAVPGGDYLSNIPVT